MALMQSNAHISGHATDAKVKTVPAGGSQLKSKVTTSGHRFTFGGSWGTPGACSVAVPPLKSACSVAVRQWMVAVQLVTTQGRHTAHVEALKWH